MSLVAVARCRADANGETDLGRRRGYLRMVRRFMTRFGVALSVAAVVLSLGASAAFGGEITGNGKSLQILPYEDSKWGTGLHARSECAYSGQEDDQFAGEEPTKGDPAHAQSWGQIPKDGPGFTRELAYALGVNPGYACNPIKDAPLP